MVSKIGQRMENRRAGRRGSELRLDREILAGLLHAIGWQNGCRLFYFWNYDGKISPTAMTCIACGGTAQCTAFLRLFAIKNIAISA
jgi:hypothetical protein